MSLERKHGSLRVAAFGVLLVLAGAAAYSNSLAGPFVFDDTLAIANNATIRQLWPLTDVLSPPPNMTVSGRPLLNLSFALNYAISGLDVWSYHALNIAIHLSAGLAIFGLVRRTLAHAAPRETFGSDATAFVAALVFVLHPLQTGSVTYVVQRAESLMSLWLFLTLYCFARGKQSSQGARLWFASSAIACLCGMATKESMVAAPILVLLYDRAFYSGSFRAALRSSWPLYAALSATWLLLGALVVSTGGRSGSAGFGVGVSPWSYALTQLGAIVHYLRLTLWPSPLVFDYGPKLANPSPLPLAANAAIVLTLVSLTLVALVRWPKAGFLGACFFAVLAPSSSILPVVTEPIVEHRMYFPLAPLVVLIAAALRLRFGPRGLVPLLVAAPILGVLTFERNKDYRDSLVLWSDTLAKAPGNARALRNVADALAEHGRLEEAIARHREALRVDPNDASQHTRIGVAQYALGRLDDASAAFEQALRIAPADADANYNLGNVFLQRGQTAKAIPYYERAVAAQPAFVWAHANLGNASFSEGRFDDAIAHYRRALELEPGAAWVHTNLGNALLKRDHVDEAIAEYRIALALDPNAGAAATQLEAAFGSKAEQPLGRP